MIFKNIKKYFGIILMCNFSQFDININQYIIIYFKYYYFFSLIMCTINHYKFILLFLHYLVKNIY